ncbi:MAG TPA: deoxyhypusine synthase family protein [Candidatus Acidoferrum sp.]|nr:deoxyhypusine synthase family protein [Candidatus Acidoferrum sp.]
MNRQRYLRHPTKLFEISADKTTDQLISEMTSTAFQGRRLGEAFEIWTRMLKKRQIVIWIGIAGAMVPAGMRKLISQLIRKRMIDVLVTTGATIYHDAYEATGGKHFEGTDKVDDVQLRKYRVDRMYDVYADEKRFYRLDTEIEKEFCSLLRDNYPYSSRQITQKLGAWLSERARDKDSISIAANEVGVPIFLPALCDSSLGFAMMFANRRRGRRIIVDHMRDVHESALITEKSSRSGVVIFGGGVPKNFIQQSAVVASYATRHDRTHDYALQVTTDAAHWGGLSGATLEEAISWGKYSSRAQMTTCHVDSTIALPILAQALADRFTKVRRNIPSFEWTADSLKITFQRFKA